MGFGTAIQATIGADVGPLQQAGTQAAATAGNIAQQMEKQFAMQKVGTALATALGLNLQNMAEQVARFFTGVSEAEEKALKELEKLSTEVADRQVAAMRERLSDEQKLQLVMQERAALEERIADNTGRTSEQQVQLQRDKLALLDKEKESTQLIDKIARESEAARKQAAQEREDLERKIRAAAEEWDRKQAQLDAERRKVTQERYDREIKLAEDRVAYVEQNLELLKLEAKAASGLTQSERERLELLRLIGKQEAINYEIKSLLSLEKRTPEEERNLQFLLKQVAQLEVQIGQKRELTQQTREQAKAENLVGTAIDSNIAKWREFSGLIRSTGRGDKDLSDRELARKRDTIEADLFERGLRSQAGGFDFFLEPQRNNLRQVNEELAFRERIRREVAAFGEDFVFRNNSGLTEQGLRDILQGVTEQQQIERETRDGIRQLNERLRAGIPVINLNAKGGG